MIPVGRPCGVWRNRMSRLPWDSLAPVSFQVPLQAAVIAATGASGRGLLLGVLGGHGHDVAPGRPYGAFLGWIRTLFGLPPGGR